MAEGRRVELLRGYKPSTVFKTGAVANRLALPYDTQCVRTLNGI